MILLPIAQAENICWIPYNNYVALGEDVKDVSRTLGHANVGITYDTYSHVIAASHRKSSCKFEETLKKASSIWI